jgi:hypothetical protein
VDLPGPPVGLLHGFNETASSVVGYFHFETGADRGILEVCQSAYAIKGNRKM